MSKFDDIVDATLDALVDKAWRRQLVNMETRILIALATITERLDTMATDDTAAWNLHNHNVAVLADGYKAARALNKVYEEQIADLQKNQQEKVNAAVQDALDGDNDADIARLEAADVVIADTGALDTPTLPTVPDPEVPTGSLPTDTVTDTPSIHDDPADGGSDVTEGDETTTPATPESDGGPADGNQDDAQDGTLPTTQR